MIRFAIVLLAMASLGCGKRVYIEPDCRGQVCANGTVCRPDPGLVGWQYRCLESRK